MQASGIMNLRWPSFRPWRTSCSSIGASLYGRTINFDRGACFGWNAMQTTRLRLRSFLPRLRGGATFKSTEIFVQKNAS